MRKRYLKRRSLEEARRLLFDRLPMGPLRVESTPAEHALGRVTAAPVTASLSAPHYHGAAMDGIAVRAEDTFGATEFQPRVLEHGAGEGRYVPVDTGSALPHWANAVVMIERVFAIDESRVEVREAAAPWQHVRLVGEDVVATEPILQRGHRVRPPDIGALLAAGVQQVSVAARPRVAILPTGSELVEPGAAAEPGRVIEFNSRMLAAYLQEWGAEPHRLPAVADDLEAIRSRIAGALADHDAVLVIAGSSAGDHDFTLAAVAALAEVIAHGVDVMPGKPAILAVTRDGKPVVGIPGYPVSAVVIAHEFVRRLVARALGVAAAEPERVAAVTPRKIPSRLGLEEIVRVTLGRVGGRLVATPLGRGAGVITTMVKADGILRIPANVEGLNAGEAVQIELLRRREEIESTILASGSHDLSLSLLEDCLKRREPAARISAANVGSIAGLVALGRGEAHLAGCHLLDPASGDYNLADVRRLLPAGAVRVVNLVRRRQGLIVAAGNPRRITRLEDLVRPDVRYVNRQPGAGTRVLLDFRLARLGLSAADVRGYEREEFTHMGVAVAVKSGIADAGLGIQQAAAALGLDFVPIDTEDYDLVLLEEFAAGALGRLLIDTIRSADFAAAVSTLAGYDTSRSGTLKAL
ncbi:MAG: molybdopterin biosynthesis protein [Deltaproteobacteria bacterium]|nr:molybdopterin biosynthesis protein [Deltaproteobacteria bacterium]